MKEVLIGSGELHWRYERGELDDKQFHEEFSRATGTKSDLAAFHKANSEIFWLNNSILPLIAHLEDSQIPLGILSNTGKEHWRTVTDGRYIILLSAFKIHALSFEAQALKPDKKFFDYAIKLAGKPAEQILFIDDIAENVEAAKQAGMDAVQYTTTDALEQELIRRGVRSNF